MSNGSEFDYDFGQKRHWRRWVWNRIAERVDSKEDALCVYLPGAEDTDKEIAIERGFKAENMIGAERDRDALGVARGNGALVANGDFWDCVLSVGLKRDVSVVFADLCCGLDLKVISKINILLGSKNFNNCVFAINLMRGRDAKTNRLRASISSDYGAVMESEAGSEKHRGAHALISLLYSILSAADEDVEVLKNQSEGWELVADRVQTRFKFMAKRSNYAFASYRSTALQTFDSVVFRNPFCGLSMPDVHGLFDAGARTMAIPSATKRSVSAVMAHRTMRMN
jgi:hypothetical protein